MARSCVRHAGGCIFESQLSHFFAMSILFFLNIFFQKLFFSKFFFQDFILFVTHASFFKMFNLNLIYMRMAGLGLRLGLEHFARNVQFFFIVSGSKRTIHFAS